MNTKLKIARFVTGKTAAYGAGIITAYAVGAVLPPVRSLPIHKKIGVYTGAFFIGAIVKEATEDKAYDMFDKAVATYVVIQQKLKEAGIE